MKDIKFRLIENNKIVGYEKHSHSGSEGLKIFHSVINDDSKGWEWWNTNDLRKWIRHDNKEQYIGKRDKNGDEIYEGDNLESEQLNPNLDIDTWTAEELGIATVKMSLYGGVSIIDEDGCYWDILDENSIYGLNHISIIGNIHEKEKT